MKCVELAMALLAEDLIVNGVSIDPESGKIDWPMGKQTEPPANDGNKKKGGKSSSKKITGGKARPGNVFGQLVNDVQSVSASQAKFKTPIKELRASTSSTNKLLDLNVNILVVLLEEQKEPQKDVKQHQLEMKKILMA